MITGMATNHTDNVKVPLLASSKMKETYYDLLVNQEKPFNLKKGSMVKPDYIHRLNLH